VPDYMDGKVLAVADANLKQKTPPTSTGHAA
jgi:hypothetical protein